MKSRSRVHEIKVGTYRKTTARYFGSFGQMTMIYIANQVWFSTDYNLYPIVS